MAVQDYRHVCFKDLENYFKKDAYFSDLTEEEKQLIRENLGLVNEGNQEILGETVQDTHINIYNLAQNGMLKIGNIYIINDFQSIYSDGYGEILGTDESKVPSSKYRLLLHPNSSSSFDPRVSIVPVTLFTPNQPCVCYYPLMWTVEYNIAPETLQGTMNQKLVTIQTKGTITYLKDHNNNSAYYDFKNIKFKRTLDELNKGPITYTQDSYLYTFDISGVDGSDLESCKNNTLAKGCYNNVFMQQTQNNVFAADAHNNTFFGVCENNTFDFGTYNNYFINDARYLRGCVHDKELTQLISMQVPKRFEILKDRQVLVYLDAETETYQIVDL